MIPHPCPACRGEGRRNEERTFTVEVPAGVEEGSTLRLADHGAAGQRGAPSGSLFVHLVVNPDPRFERSGDDLHTTMTIGLAQAALGTECAVETLEGTELVTVAAGTPMATCTTSRAMASRICADEAAAISSCTR